MSTTHGQQKQAEFLEWVKTEPELHKHLNGNIEVIESIYRLYFELGFGLSPERAVDEARTARQVGFPLRVKTGRGDLKVFLDPLMSLLDLYFEILKNQLGLDLAKFTDYDVIATNATDIQKEMATHFCALYLMNFVLKLQGELFGTVVEVSQIAKIETAKQAGIKLNLRLMIEAISKETEKRRKRDAGVKSGGKRLRKGFTWDPKKKAEFSEAVRRTPQIKGKSIWEYACDELIEEEFDVETVRWLLTRPAFKTIDHDLFKEAVKRWRKYDERADIVDDNDKPRHFEYRQALISLGIPDTFAFSTLENYYYTGQNAV